MATRRTPQTAVNATAAFGTTLQLGASYNQAAHDCGLIAVRWEAASNPTCTVNDTAGNTFTPLTKATTGSTMCVQIFYCLDMLAHASNIVQAVFSATADYGMLVVSPFLPTGPVSFVAAPTAGTGSGGQNPLTPSFAAGSIGIAVCAEDAGITMSPASGWSQVLDATAAGGHVIDRIDSPGGTITAGLTQAGAPSWVIASASFVEGVGSGPGPLFFRRNQQFVNDVIVQG